MSTVVRTALLALLCSSFASCGGSRTAPVEPARAQSEALPARPTPRLPAAAVAVSPAPVDSVSPWTSFPIDADPESFRFAVVTDRTGGHRPGVFEQGVEKTKLLKPDFVMSVGDLIEGYTDRAAEIEKQWDEFRDMVNALGTRFYYVPGNHDISNPEMARAWSRRFGPAYYHFVYNNVLFLCLNTEDGAPNEMSDEQLAYFERVLGEYRRVRWTLLFMHRPLWTQKETAHPRVQFERLEQLLAGRPYTVFAGHYHNYEKYVRRDQRYFTLATTGGASSLRGPLFGEFDHVAWVTMTSAGPRVANLLLSGIQGEDVRTEASAQRVSKYVADFHVDLQNVYQKSDHYAGGRTTLEVVNDTPSAVNLQAAFGPTGSVRPVPHAVSVDVPAGQRQRVNIELQLPRPTALSALPKLPFRWTANFATGSEPPITLSDEFAFVVAPSYDVVPRQKPVLVDGRLDEWGKLRVPVTHAGEIVGRENWTGPDDAHYDFELAYDERNLYLAVDVTDDRIAAVKARPPWEQDSIELQIDPRDDPERAKNRRDYGETWRSYAYLAFSPAATRAEMAIWEADRIPAGVEFATAVTARGYSAEIAIPHAVLDALRARGNWEALRFNIALHDAEEPGGPNTALWWQPDWHKSSNVPGSGTFRRRK